MASANPASPLTPSALGAGLGTLVVGREITCFDVCDSTNTRARLAAAAGALDGAAFFAEAQTAGRGQRDRVWLDQPGSCLLVSVLLRPSLSSPDLASPGLSIPGLSINEAHYLTMLAATAAAAAVESAAGLAVELKWPNDLVVGERKLAGILVETSLLGESTELAVVGIGLNVNLDVSEHHEIAATATSLARELGRAVDRTALARELLREIDRRYAMLKRGDRPAIFGEWRRRLGTLGRRVAILDAVGGTRRVVQVEDVQPDGALVGRLADGSRVVYHFGEVSLQPPS